jgi:hypothetical protein
MDGRRRVRGGRTGCRHEEGHAGADGAPDVLRKRVLAQVRGGQAPRASSGAGARRHARLIVLGVSLALAYALTLLLVSGSRQHASKPAQASARGAHAALRRIGGHAELAVSGLPEPPIGEIYEVWLKRAGAPPQATDALFTVTRSGAGSVDVPGSLQGVREVMVTSEPLGGSAKPTGPLVLELATGSSG